ncbi:hypothetical protein JL720_4414 [Aureococcus anophagefferens]|nr:hypothetical protein JL720_4414 [Aureococcus anophagefferens]
MPRAKPVLLVLLALFARGGDAAQLTTNYKRVGKRVEFGGSWLIRETFDDGVDAARAAAWLEDPRRVLAAAWPAEHIRASDGGGGDVLAFALTQDPIDFAGLVHVDCVVGVGVASEPRGGVSLASRSVEAFATLRGKRRPVPMDFRLRGHLEGQPDAGGAAALVGSFEYPCPRTSSVPSCSCRTARCGSRRPASTGSSRSATASPAASRGVRADAPS